MTIEIVAVAALLIAGGVSWVLIGRAFNLKLFRDEKPSAPALKIDLTGGIGGRQRPPIVHNEELWNRADSHDSLHQVLHEALQDLKKNGLPEPSPTKSVYERLVSEDSE